MRHGFQTIAPMDRVIFGARTAEAVADEAAARGAQRIFLLVSGTLNRKTDEIAKVREALSSRYAGEFDDMPYGPLPAGTGKVLRFTGTTVLKVENGLITQEIGLDDGVTALTQLGLITKA